MLERAEDRYIDSQNFQSAVLANQMTQQNNQMQIAQMNNQLQMRREDRREARLEKQDRQQMIMMLMKGLSGLGQSFVI